MAASEILLTSGMLYCTAIEHPKEIIRKKIKTILELASGGFLLRFIEYHRNFWRVCLKSQQTLFREALGKFIKKIILYL